MKNYDPNIYGTHVVQVTFQEWEYTGHVAWKIGGNCRGADLLDCDFLETHSQEDISEYVINDCEFELDEEDEILSAVLKNENGDSLIVDGDSRDFEKMIVRIEILDVIPDSEEE